MQKIIISGSLFLVSLAFLVPSEAFAQVPACTAETSLGGSSASELVNEEVTFNVSIDNTDAATGFRPGVDLVIPKGLTFTSATFENAAVSATGPSVFPSSGALRHPLTDEVVSGTAGDTLVVLNYPVTAQPQSMPELVLEVTVTIDDAAPIGTALPVAVDCAYYFGTDAVNDPDADPPVRATTSFPITPLVIQAKKGAPRVTCTGPTYEFDYVIQIDAAEGANIDAFDLTDALPDEFFFLGATLPAGASQNSSPPAVGVGRSLEFSMPAITGVAGIDAEFRISGYVNDGTVNLANPVDVPVINTVTVHGPGSVANPIALDSGASSVPPTTQVVSTKAGAFQVEEVFSLANTVPGDVGTMTLNFCVSDNIDMDDITVTSVLGDGLIFDDTADTFEGAGVPACAGTPAALCANTIGAGPTTIEFFVGNLLGGKFYEIVYPVEVAQFYNQTGEPVLAGDLITTTQTLGGSVASTGASATANESGGLGDDSVPLSRPVFTKITTSPAPPDNFVAAGEVVTWEIQADFASGDVGAMTVTDFVPKPIFDASGCTVAPLADNEFNLNNTTVDGVGGDNFIALDFDPITRNPTTSVTMHYEITCTVLDGPADDGFNFTNVASLVADNTAGSVTSFAFTDLFLSVPELDVLKSASQTTADAGDTVSFEIVLSNTNSGDEAAFDVFVADRLPVGMTLAAGPSIIDGSFVGVPADLFSPAGVEISDIAAGGAPTISYDVTLDAGVSSNTVLTNIASVTNFASTDGGPNHAAPSNSDSATVRVTRFAPAKELSTRDTDFDGVADAVGVREYTIGDDLYYNIVVTIPEGVHSGVSIVDTLDPGMKYLGFTDDNAATLDCGPAAGPTTPCSMPAPVITSSGRVARFNFADSIHNPSGAGAKTLRFAVQAGIDDDGTNSVRGAVRDNLVSVTGAANRSSTVTLVEPDLVGAGALGGTGDAGDTVSLTTTLDHSAVSNSDAHDISVVWDFSGVAASPVVDADLLDPVVPGCASAASAVATATTITINFDTLAELADCQLQAPVVLGAGLNVGDVIAVPGTLSYESLLGDGFDEAVADERTYTKVLKASYAVPYIGSIAKGFVDTTSAATADPAFAIGEQARYRISVALPDGLSEKVIICDAPPVGASIAKAEFNTAGFVGTIANPPAGALAGAQGAQLCWDFGNVQATAGAGQVGNSFSIDVYLEAEYVAGMAAGSPQNSAGVTVNGVARGSASASVTYALPTPVVALTAATNTPEAGDPVTFTASLTNTADAPVCDTTVTVTVPSGFSVSNLDSDGLDNDGNSGVDEGDEQSLVVGNSIVFPVVGCLDDTNPTILFPFIAVAEQGVAPTTVNATATLSNYGSLPGGAGDALSPAMDGFNNNGVGGTDEAGDGTAAFGLTPTAPELTFEKTVVDDNGSPLEPAETITYTVSLKNSGTGAATGVTLSDTLPTNNINYVMGSAQVTPSTLVITDAGGVVEANVGTLAAGDSVVVTFQMKVASPLPVGSSFSNQASGTADNGYGPLLSDNPGTGAVDDPTVIATSSTDDEDGDGVCNTPTNSPIGCTPGVDCSCLAGPDDDDSNPNDCQDLDNDGCDDCGNVFPPSPGDDGADLDGDGLCNIGDIDADNDGIPDVDENALGIDPYGDSDNDGIPNYLDADDQGDETASACADINEPLGECDELSPLFDTDGDGVADHLDLDSDNDGIPDVVEAGHGADDLDGDGILDGPYNDNGIATSVDADGDGTLDYVVRDTDQDGVPDFQDTDSDDDGLTDIEESGNGALDVDLDGMVDDVTDADGDGIVEGVDDDDAVVGGAAVNAPDLDANFDEDNDGIPDPYDFDDNGDGGDSNGDGIADAVQCPNPPGWTNCPDADNDGTPDYSEPTDTDGDGVADASDIDADNDGIPDVLENLIGVDPYADNDNDGIPNYLDSDDRGDGVVPACDDLDMDGFCDVVAVEFDQDGDGIANHLDLDSDNDGIPDVTEAGHGQDINGDGFADCPSGVGVNGLCDDLESSPDSGMTNYPLLNTDGALIMGSDDIPDFLDLDSDGDGKFDIDEVLVLAGLDGDGDGMIDDMVDPDGDGVMSIVDHDSGVFGGPFVNSDDVGPDTDFDGIPDVYDLEDSGTTPGDSDGDGVPDDVECNNANGWICQDIDGDGTPDYMEPADADGDGVPDVFDLDDDNDCVPDTLESPLGLDGSADSDGDGIPNAVDATDRGDGVAADCSDGDENGACDQLDPIFDMDGDGIPNQFDLDADGDNIFDHDEAGCSAADADGDGAVDCQGGFGENGLCDAVESSPDSGTVDPQTDTDGDGDPDFLDLDSDGDGIPDAFEAGDDDPATDPVDTDGDGVPDYQDLDSDGDGLLDADEAGAGGENPTDTDQDGTPDFQDVDSDGDGYDDNLGINGGGCNSGGGTGSPFGLLLCLMFVVGFRRKSGI